MSLQYPSTMAFAWRPITVSHCPSTKDDFPLQLARSWHGQQTQAQCATKTGTPYSLIIIIRNIVWKKRVSDKNNKISPKQSVQKNQAGRGGAGRGGAGRGGAERGGAGRGGVGGAGRGGVRRGGVGWGGAGRGEAGRGQFAQFSKLELVQLYCSVKHFNGSAIFTRSK